jgi:hypothetical protein
MSAGMIGAFVGLALAFASAGFLFALSRRVEMSETKRVLRVTAAAELVLLPALGWFLGPLIAGE